MTLVAQTHVPDEVFEEVKKEFSEAEIVDLTHAVMAINAWNRMAISTRLVLGEYKAVKKETAGA